MNHNRVLVSLFCLVVCQSGWADLTLRHSLEMKFGAFLPPEAVEAVQKQIASGFPKEIVTRVKGDKVYSKSGPVTSVTDCNTDQITLLDTASKRYATVPMADYPGALQSPETLSPELQDMFHDLKFDVRMKQTGRSGMLQGIRADEYEIVIALEMPGPQQTAAGFTLTIQQWIANPEEVNRIPAVKEFAGYSARVRSKTNSYDVIEKVFSRFPGMSEKFRAPFEELLKRNDNLVLKMQVAGHAPAFAQPGFDADAPLFEFSMNLARISTEAIPDSVFEMPNDYQAAPMEELLQTAMPFRPALSPTAYGQAPPLQ